MSKLMPIVQGIESCSLDANLKCTRCGNSYVSAEKGQLCQAGPIRTIGWMFWCPGCKFVHSFYTVEHRTQLGMQPNAMWTFNGDQEKPTFSPSLQVNRPGDRDCCHLHVIDGVIQYCNDGGTAHPLKGTSVPLGEFKWHEDE